MLSNNQNSFVILQDFKRHIFDKNMFLFYLIRIVQYKNDKNNSDNFIYQWYETEESSERWISVNELCLGFTVAKIYWTEECTLCVKLWGIMLLGIEVFSYIALGGWTSKW